MTRNPLFEFARPAFEALQHPVIADAIDAHDAVRVPQDHVGFTVNCANVRSARRLQRLTLRRRPKVGSEGATDQILFIHVSSLNYVGQTEFTGFLNDCQVGAT